MIQHASIRISTFAAVLLALATGPLAAAQITGERNGFSFSIIQGRTNGEVANGPQDRFYSQTAGSGGSRLGQAKDGSADWAIRSATSR